LTEDKASFLPGQVSSPFHKFLAVSWVARGFFFVFIVLKHLKKAQNISVLLHANFFVLFVRLFVWFFFPEGGGENVLGDNSDCFTTCSFPRQSYWILKSFNIPPGAPSGAKKGSTYRNLKRGDHFFLELRKNQGIAVRPLK